MGKAHVVVFVLAGALTAAGCGSNTPEASDEPADPGTGELDPGMDASTKPYPPAPYGVTSNTIIKNYSFLGWTNPKAVSYKGELEPIELADFYDPDGEKGIKALVINASARWCTVCRMEQPELRKLKAEYGPRGVAFLETLFEDENYDVPSVSDLSWWASAYAIDWPLCLDPRNKLGDFFDTTATPMNMVVDTKTMRVVAIHMGLPPQTWWRMHLGRLL